jgi:hypothetical protein
MNKEQNFLVRYGLHNFVTVALAGDHHVFAICKAEGRKMVGHAQYLIKESFGEAAEVRLD